MNLLISILFAFAAILPTDTEMFEAIKRDPYLAAGNLHPYIAPQVKNPRELDTRAPKGFKPFYFSYYGRHGSRYLTGDISTISSLVELFDTLSAQGKLTEEGEKLKGWLQWSEKEHKDNMGALTSTGYKEEQGICRRYAKRYKRIFRQRGRRMVVSRSSPSLRSALTGSSFAMELRRNFPRLDFDVLAGYRYYFTKWDDNKQLDKAEEAVTDSLIKANFDTVAFVHKFFKDESALRKALKGKGVDDLEYITMHILSVSKCIDADADPFECFSTEEIYRYAIVQNARAASWFLHSKETGVFRDTNAGRPLINEFICRADEAIKGNGICANLRFGHDSGVAPMFSFLHAQGYEQHAPLAETYITWPNYKHIFMACHLAMVFYRNRKGEVLVKLLENEKETAIPAIPSYSGPYYRWEDFKEYCSRRI